MHMADALMSPAVGGTMWVVSGGLIAYSARKVREASDERKVPLMGVLAAFIFAAQMINFTIPGTGSSGHLGGGMILSILLGPYAAFLALASVLTVQALFFADGGLLALGANIFNMGFFTCFLAYPFIYKPFAGAGNSKARVSAAAVLAAVVGLQLGAFGVVLETRASGISELPFGTFLLLMQPIHLAIGIVEGFVTAGVVSYVLKARPEILASASSGQNIGVSVKRVAVGLAAAAVIVGTAVSWLASSRPDGLEWAMLKTSGMEELEAEGELYGRLGAIQEKTSFMPDYGFRGAGDNEESDGAEEEGSWPAVDPGTSAAGFAGGLLTLGLAGLAGWGLKRRRKGS